MEAPQIASQIENSLSGGYWVTDWTQDFANMFKALNMEKTVMGFILLLIITVAGFNLVSSLVMMVTDKRSDIAILRTLGASSREIMGIFIAQGGFVGLMGVGLGTLSGLFVAFHITAWVTWIEQTCHINLIVKDIYFTNFLPSQVMWGDVIEVAVAAIALSFIATIYPAWKASKIQPAEALRYE